MGSIKILDCTLRDGGYVNNNNFGFKNISRIIQALNDSKVDFIEVGYIKDTKDEYSSDVTEWITFKSLEKEQKKYLNKDGNYTLMLLGEEYYIDNLPPATSSNQIIRMSFHKKSVNKALHYAKIIKDLGYKLFLQPTVTIGYSNNELVEMLKAINEINPYCVAIVDTFGEMREKDVVRLSKCFDKYLNKNIMIGFHAHNNLQLAFSNAIAFIQSLHKKRVIVIDTSIYGMGRGAGNLPTELVANYLNENYHTTYKIEPLLKVVDNVISKIKDEHNWGYSLEYYLSAIHSVHPSYIINFMRRKTLNTCDINELINLMSNDKKTEYNEEYANELYNTFNDNTIDDQESYNLLKKKVKNKTILLIGPGISIKKYQPEIESLLKDKSILSISVNNKLIFKTDYIFISNKKRYETISKEPNDKIIITSNIKNKSNNEIVFDYKKSLSKEVGVSDNSLLVLLNIISNVTDSVILAGFDGFYTDKNKNFYDSNIEFILDKNYALNLNNFIRKNIKEYMKKITIKTITPSIYMRRKNEDNSDNSSKI